MTEMTTAEATATAIGDTIGIILDALRRDHVPHRGVPASVTMIDTATGDAIQENDPWKAKGEAGSAYGQIEVTYQDSFIAYIIHYPRPCTNTVSDSIYDQRNCPRLRFKSTNPFSPSANTEHGSVTCCTRCTHCTAAHTEACLRHPSEGLWA